MSTVKEMCSRELHYTEFIAGLDAQLANGMPYLEERLKSIPDAWRQFRIAQTATDKLIRGLYQSMPDKQLNHMIRLIEFGEVVIRPKPVCKLPEDVQIVQTADLKLLINAAMSGECAVCIKEPHLQKRCKLYKAMMNICPPKELKHNGLCPYVEIAAASELGKYI